MSIDFELVSQTAAATARYIEEKPEKRSSGAAKVPQRVTFFAQFNAGKTPTVNIPVQILSLGDIQTRAGRGSMAALMYKSIASVSGNVDIYWCPLADDAAGVVATKTITVTGPATSAGTSAIFIAGIKVKVAVAKSDTAAAIATAIAAAINANLDLPMTASSTDEVVTLTARNKGAAGQLINLSQDLDTGDSDSEPSGVTLVFANVTTGATDPSCAAALANLGDDWHTVLVNPFVSDTACDEFEASFITRIDPATKRPFVMIIGYVGTLSEYIAFLTARNSPATTIVPVEGSPCHPWEIASVAAGLYARYKQSSPAPLTGRVLTGIRGNSAYVNWTGAQREVVVADGGTWTRLDSTGSVHLGDLVTTYKTNDLGVADAGDTWRFTDTVSNMQAKIYSIDALIASEPYVRAVVVDDDSPSSKSYVVRPKTLKAALIALVDSWIDEAWSKDRDAIVAGIKVEINADNAGRLDFYIPDVMAPGLRIIAAKYGWAFTAAA
jgi:phage tail sheath gpL-like